MENKELIKKEDIGFFGRIIKYFKNIFSKSKIEKVENIEKAKVDINNENETKEIKPENTNDFLESLKVEEVLDYFNVLTLQNKFEAGEISEDDLTDEEYEALAQKYINEIEELKIKINQRKVQLGIA